MTDSSLDALAAAASRRNRLWSWGLFLFSMGLTIWLTLAFGLAGVAGAILWALFWYLELFTLSGELRLETTKSPAAVREDFTGPDIPIFALIRGMFDEVTDVERGFEWENSGWWSTSTGRIEAAESEADYIEIRIFEDEVHVRTVPVAIEPYGELTRVTASIERDANAALVVLALLYDPLETQALAAQGYSVLANETSIF